MVDEGPTGIKAPDGGWGWAVLFGCFVVTGFSYAFPKAVSVFFKELMREFGIGYSDTAWISSILLAMLYGTGEGLSRLAFTSGAHHGPHVQEGLGAGGGQGPGGPRAEALHGAELAQAKSLQDLVRRQAVPAQPCVVSEDEALEPSCTDTWS